MGSNRKRLSKYLSRKSLTLYYFYAFGLWVLFFLYKDSKLPLNAQASVWELFFKSLLLAALTLAIAVLVIRFITNKGRRHRKSSDKGSLN